MKRFKLTFTFLAILFSGINLNAQWVQVNSGIGNHPVYSLAASGNYIFAGTMPNGVYLSTNNGTNWIQTSLNNRAVWSLAVNGNNIFAGTNGYGIYSSTDNGTSWTPTSLNNQNVWAIVISGNNVFAGTEEYGIYRSTNNGTTWAQTSLNNRTVVSLAISGNNVFAGTANFYGIYLSTNNGTDWTQTSLNNYTVYSLSVNGNNIFAGSSNGVYLSSNNRTSWTLTPLNYAFAYGLVSNGNYIFAATSYYGFFISNNNGTNWTQRNEGLFGGTLFDLCMFNNYIFAGTEGAGVYRRPLSELVGITPISSEIPEQFSLSQNYPNPFNPNTKIKFQIPTVAQTFLSVYDLLGREVATLVNEQLSPGAYEVDWDGGNFSSGIYYYTLQTEGFTETRKMVLLK